MQKITLSDKVANYIRDKIVRGELQPNDKIIEQDVAKELGISRGPVRDGLKVLMFEGLVNYEPNKGCSVMTLSSQDAYEIFFMRGSLEKIALERSGGILTDEAVFKMQVALDRMKKACEEDSLSGIIVADEMFHRQIIEAGRMFRLTKMWNMLSPLNGAMFLTIKNAKRVSGDIFAEPSPTNKYVVKHANNYEAHKALLEVLKRGDLHESCLCLDSHYLVIGEKIYRAGLREQANNCGYL